MNIFSNAPRWATPALSRLRFGENSKEISRRPADHRSFVSNYSGVRTSLDLAKLDGSSLDRERSTPNLVAVDYKLGAHTQTQRLNFMEDDERFESLLTMSENGKEPKQVVYHKNSSDGMEVYYLSLEEDSVSISGVSMTHPAGPGARSYGQQIYGEVPAPQS